VIQFYIDFRSFPLTLSELLIESEVNSWVCELGNEPSIDTVRMNFADENQTEL